MTAAIKRCREEKTRCIRAIDGFRKKLMTPDPEIPRNRFWRNKLTINIVYKNKIKTYCAKCRKYWPKNS